MFKAEEPLKKLCKAPSLLSKGGFNHSVSFFACFHYLCTKVSYSQDITRLLHNQNTAKFYILLTVHLVMILGK